MARRRGGYLRGNLHATISNCGKTGSLTRAIDGSYALTRRARFRSRRSSLRATLRPRRCDLFDRRHRGPGILHRLRRLQIRGGGMDRIACSRDRELLIRAGVSRPRSHATKAGAWELVLRRANMFPNDFSGSTDARRTVQDCTRMFDSRTLVRLGPRHFGCGRGLRDFVHRCASSQHQWISRRRSASINCEGYAYCGVGRLSRGALVATCFES